MFERLRRCDAFVVLVLLAAAACAPGRAPGSPSPVDPPALEIVATSPNVPPYNRDDWRHWIDADGDCQDTRAEVLVGESLPPILFRDPRNCVVDSGRWQDPYTGLSVSAASDLEVDHLVPLANAHRSGGWSWSSARKEQFANDLSFPNHLVAVTVSVNRSKSDRGPEAWRPPNRGFWCDYGKAWLRVKRTWSLSATEAEWIALRELLAECPSTVR